MAQISTERLTAQIEGDFVVFMIGMRINHFWKFHKWIPVAIAMPGMIRELYADPDSGFWGARFGFGETTQYWKSTEHLNAYARNKNASHFPAWVKFNKRIGYSGDVGIWHETYKVRAGEYETIYHNMPPFGLGKIGKLIPATGKYMSANRRANPSIVGETPKDPDQDILYPA